MLQFKDMPCQEAPNTFKFLEETAFGWRFSSKLGRGENKSSNYHVCFYSGLHANSDLRVVDVVCRQGFKLFTAFERHQDEDGTLQIFDVTLTIEDPSDPIVFEVYIRSSVDSVTMQLMDSLLTKQLWTAAENGEWTDVQISVGDQTFKAHRWVLAARSPVFNRIFSRMLLEDAASSEVHSDTTPEKETSNAILCFSGVHPSVVQQMLRFVYTGTLQSAPSESLLAIAEKYEIKTLVKLCQASMRRIDIEQLSIKLLSL